MASSSVFGYKRCRCCLARLREDIVKYLVKTVITTRMEQPTFIHLNSRESKLSQQQIDCTQGRLMILFVNQNRGSKSGVSTLQRLERKEILYERERKKKPALIYSEPHFIIKKPTRANTLAERLTAIDNKMFKIK